MKRVQFLLLSIIILATILRLYHVTSVPAGFFADEADIGYNAWKLLKTGKDEHDVSWPIFFQGFGDYRTPIPIYSAIPFVSLFGLNEFAVRGTSATFGIGTVVLMYFIGSEMMKKRSGLLSAFFLAILPWDLHMSRWGSEYASFPFFFAAGLLCFLFTRKHAYWIIPSAVCFGLTLYTYYTAWVVVPLFLVGAGSYWIVIQRLRGIRYVVCGIILFLIISSPLIQEIKSGKALTRWKAIQQQPKPKQQVIMEYQLHYLDHFGIPFLFVSGDIGYPNHFISRQSVRGMGELYIFMAPLLLIGVVRASRNIQKRWILIYWLLLLYPLGSVLTGEGPFSTRSFIGVIPLILFIAFGMDILMFTVLRQKQGLWTYWVKGIFFVVILSCFCSYLRHYYWEYPLYSSDYWGWQYGPKEIISYFEQKQDQYDELILNGNFNMAQIFVPFYTLDGKTCGKCKTSWVINSYNPKKRQLFAPDLHEFKEGPLLKHPFLPQKTIYYPDGTPAFQIGEIGNTSVSE